MLRLLLDENLPDWISETLRQKGLDAVDIREIGGSGLSDEEVYNRAQSEKRHIVSSNFKQFGNPILFPPSKHTGIVVLRLPKCSTHTMASRLIDFLSNA
ncbi:MAG: DUF5615 family PIN-like protein [Elusimicrobia bacterium]|nr:DUF5615 family PIN-like protein [Elusimicrobiota bacterium]